MSRQKGLTPVRGVKPHYDDILCPISCGRCCAEMGIRAADGVMQLPRGKHELLNHCVHVGPNGCLLPRGKRSVHCNGYLCPVAKAVRIGDVTLERGRQIVKEMRPWLW